MDARYELDSNNAASNLVKHGVSFAQAINVFKDENRIEIQDRFQGGEERWQTIGMVEGCALLLVAHTVREDGQAEVIRIISARQATKQERKNYEGQ